MPLYEDIFSKYLKIPGEFLKSIKPAVVLRLNCAAKEMDREDGEVFAINQCLHLASSIVLRNPSFLPQTLSQVRATSGLENVDDPTRVVTVSTLYHVLKELLADKGEEKKAPRKNLVRLHERLDKMEWLVGEEPMGVLGIKPLKSKHASRLSTP